MLPSFLTSEERKKTAVICIPSVNTSFNFSIITIFILGEGGTAEEDSEEKS